MDLDVGRKLIIPVVLMAALFIILLQLQGLGLEQHVSEAYASYYWQLAVIGFLGILATVVFGFKYGDLLGLPTWTKGAIVAVWVIFIVFISMPALGGQIIPVPKASAASFQLTPETELYTSSVIPAITEDLAFLWFFPMVIILLTLLIMEYGIGIEITGTHLAAVAVIACLVASIGYNIWLIPGFTSAHVPAYGNQQTAYTGAFVFSFGQSMVYVFTGWFVPVAHAIHNFIVTSGQVYQYNIGGFNVIGG